MLAREQDDPRLFRDREGNVVQYLLWRPATDDQGARVRLHWSLLVPLAVWGWFLALASPFVVGWWSLGVFAALSVATLVLFQRSLLYPDSSRDVLRIAARVLTHAGAMVGAVALVVALAWFASSSPSTPAGP